MLSNAPPSKISISSLGFECVERNAHSRIHATFRKDLERAWRRGKDMAKFKIVVEILLANESLPIKYNDHKLQGKYVHCRECHIEPDWLLIYTRVFPTLRLERTGSHADLFA
jgi:mRNA interferase YafQ